MKLVLDPGMAFGTGRHTTTMLSIQGLEKSIGKNDIIIDVSCGAGVLTIASGLVGAGKVSADDLDEVAVRITNINKKIHAINEEVIAAKNNLLDGITQEADVIVAAILAEIIVDLI